MIIGGIFVAGVATLSLANAKPYIPPQPEPVAIEAVAETETEPEREYLGTWTVTEYCTRCNSGSAHQTASGARAEEYWTCAVSKANYRKWKGYKLYVEGWGTYEIQDWGSVHGCNKDKWVDLFLPTNNHNKVWDKREVYLIKGNE